jgi:coenzyme PQQ precursor peptide PqqA
VVVEENVKWEKPTFEEMCVNMEVTGYVKTGVFSQGRTEKVSGLFQD